MMEERREGGYRTMLRSARLRSLPGFRALSSRDLAHLCTWMSWHRIRRGQQFQPKFASDIDVFVVIEGKVGVMFATTTPKSRCKVEYGPGEYFGAALTAPLDGAQVDVVGLADGVVARIARHHFLKVAHLHPEIILAVHLSLCATVKVLRRSL